MTTRLSRPAWPCSEDERRVIQSEAREQILDQDWEELASAWLEEEVSAERLTLWGRVDTSRNPLATISRQLSSPGHYSERPTVQAPLGGEPLSDPGGWLDRAHWQGRLQRVEYLVTGMGDYLIQVGVEDGEPYLRPVSPRLVYIEGSPSRADRPVLLQELRLRTVSRPHPLTGQPHPVTLYAWDVYDIRDPQAPSVRCLAWDPELGRYEDWTDLVWGPVLETTGSAYPWVDSKGRPLIPYVIYRAEDSGQRWNWRLRHDVHRGALVAARNWTYTGRGALAATGRAVVAIDMDRPGADVGTPGGPGRAASIPLEPGSMLFLRSARGEAAAPQGGRIQEVGPGVDLQSLTAYSSTHEEQLLASYGLGQGDVVRSSANPWSASALFVVDAAKRNYQIKTEGLWRSGDLELIRVLAVVLRVAGLGAYPEEGYAIRYARMAPSPQEQQAAREERQALVEQGQMSRIQAYQQAHPGATRADALLALIQVAEDEAELEQALALIQPQETEASDEESDDAERA